MKLSIQNIAIILFIISIFNIELYSQITIDTSFEGANARVLSINNAANTIKIESVLRAGDIHNVVFYLRISGFNVSLPLKIQVKISQQYYLPVYAAYSYDRVNWTRFTGTITGDSKEFSRIYTQNNIYFSFGYPYTYSDMLNLESSFNANPYVNISNIAVSSGGRNIKLFKFTEQCVNDSSKYSIWILGRNHAMETHSNYVVEGLCNFLASNNYQADILRRQAVIYVVPIMDVDKAFSGGTGKDQLPVDFNRDWDSPSYWPAVNAVKQLMLQSTINNPVKIFIDSHDPFPSQNDNNTFFYASQSGGIRSVNLDQFRKLLLDNSGYVFNRELLYATDGQTAQKWADSVFSSIDFSTGLETGWVSRTDNILWTIPLYKQHGEFLGKGISDYITNIIRAGDIILDNTDTANGVTIIGSWQQSTFLPGYWGINYLHDGNTGQGSKSVKYTPGILTTGDYEVYLRWTSANDRALNIPVRIIHSTGIKDTVINQRVRGSSWVSVGAYRFDQGNLGSITISNSSANGFVIADAVRFSMKNNCNPIGLQNTQIPEKFYVNVSPNPFNPATNFKVSIPLGSFVVIKVFDLNGRSINTIVDNYLNAGEYNFKFNGNDLASGVYFYSVKIYGNGNNPGIHNYSGKLILIK